MTPGGHPLTRACVLVPMKRFALAKSRLSARLAEAERSALARAMFERVLDAARGDGCSTCVITNGDDVAEVARHAGAHVLRDPQPMAALGELIDHGLVWLSARGAERALILMADLPQILPSDVRTCLDELDAVDMAVCADRRRRSTNALALRLPFAAPTAFGHPDSYREHLARAASLGLRVRELPNARLAHDVDTEEDLPRR